MLITLTSLAGDADLYVGCDYVPSFKHYSFAATSPGEDALVIPVPREGSTLFISIYSPWPYNSTFVLNIQPLAQTKGGSYPQSINLEAHLILHNRDSHEVGDGHAPGCDGEPWVFGGLIVSTCVSNQRMAKRCNLEQGRAIYFKF